MTDVNISLLHNIAECIRTLLGCDGACIVLRSFDDALCHPQCRQILSAASVSLSQSARSVPGYYGTITDAQLLTNERVLAYCDMALQTGDLWLLNASAFATHTLADNASAACDTCDTTASTGHVSPPTAFLLITPLECPDGMLGLLFCTAYAEHVPGSTEQRFLQQFLPRISQLVEAALLTPATPDDSGDPEFAEIVAACTQPTQPAQPTQPGYDELFSIIGHDLRTPLSVIKGYAGLLQEYGFVEIPAESSVAPSSLASTEMTPACRQRYFQAIMEQIDHLEVLINDLLDISRLRSGRINLCLSHVALDVLCQEVTQQMQDHIERQQPGRYSIQCLGDPALPPVLADVHRVRQVIMNLLENAVKYSPDGGLVEVFVYTHCVRYQSNVLTHLSRFPDLLQLNHDHLSQTETGADMVYVTVCDHGVGIPLQQQPVLFRPFKRLAHLSQASAAIAGSGLGLYISRRLLDAMHGHILLRSHEGQGTSVTFALPIAVPPAQTIPPHPYRIKYTVSPV